MNYLLRILSSNMVITALGTASWILALQAGRNQRMTEIRFPLHYKAQEREMEVEMRFNYAMVVASSASNAVAANSSVTVEERAAITLLWVLCAIALNFAARAKYSKSGFRKWKLIITMAFTSMHLVTILVYTALNQKWK